VHRPPRDPVNSLLSFGYTLLVYDIQAAIRTVRPSSWSSARGSRRGISEIRNRKGFVSVGRQWRRRGATASRVRTCTLPHNV
jgi:hypothetical protein